MCAGYIEMFKGHIEVPVKESIENGNLPVLGILGAGLLRRFDAVLDFGNGKMYLHR